MKTPAVLATLALLCLGVSPFSKGQDYGREGSRLILPRLNDPNARHSFHDHHRFHHNGVYYISIPTPYGRMYITEDTFYQTIYLDTPSPNTAAAPVQSPIGAVLTGLPKGFSTLLFEGKTLFYHQGVYFAQKGDEGFEVINAPIGAIIKELPNGAKPNNSSARATYRHGNVIYEPVLEYGKTVYKVIGN